MSALAVPAVTAGAGTAVADPGARGQGPPPGLTARTVLDGHRLTHTFMPAGGPATSGSLSGPDDLTRVGSDLFVVFQNGVGPQGQPAADGNTASTVVAFTPGGQVIGQWDIVGHADGLTADPRTGRLLATVNEDANSSLYVIDPAAGSSAGSVQHYSYEQNPLPHNGGTDAISFYGGRILISASAPGTTGPAAPQPQYPAVYSVSLDPQTRVASVAPLFSDTATASSANVGPGEGRPVSLGLTDPDSNEVVPGVSPRFAGDFVLDSQGDQQQIYVSDPGGPAQHLSVLALDQAVNDAAWATSRRGILYATDASSDTVDAVTGDFPTGTAFVAATPCDANNAPATCAGNFLGTLDLGSGHVSPVPLAGGSLEPGGLLFVAHARGDNPEASGHQ